MEWQAAKDIGYTPKTTFWQDFTIADQFGMQSIKDTAERAFNEWKDNIEYLTELIMVINHKCWYWNEKNQELSYFYSDLYYQYDDMAINYIEETMGQKELSYYFNTLD